MSYKKILWGLSAFLCACRGGALPVDSAKSPSILATVATGNTVTTSTTETTSSTSTTGQTSTATNTTTNTNTSTTQNSSSSTSSGTSTSTAVSTPTQTPQYNGAAALLPAGGKHLLVTWIPASGASGYNIYVASTPGGENLSSPTILVNSPNASSAAIANLADDTTYYAIVRAIGITDQNTNEVSATTLSYPTLPSTVAAKSMYATIGAYFGYAIHALGIGEMGTFAGKYDEPAFVTTLNLGLGRFGPTIPSSYGIAKDAAGNFYLSLHTGPAVVYKVDSYGNMTVFAGNGTAGFSGDNGAATAASLNQPAGINFDSLGNLYIADYANNRLRIVNTAGTISTYAGNGTAGFGGDGSTATSAKLNGPVDIKFDANGNLYFTDRGNNRLRKIVTTTGIISTVAGTGASAESGDSGQATSAGTYAPSRFNFDSQGNIYMVDLYGETVRKINTSGFINTVAGSGTAGFSGDGGAATNAKLYYPVDALPDGQGNFYVTDYWNSRIRFVTSSGIISTIAGNGNGNEGGDTGPASSAYVGYPVALLMDTAGNIFVNEESFTSASSSVRKLTSNGLIDTFIGPTSPLGYSGDGLASTSATLNSPAFIAFDPSGNFYIADEGNNAIRVINTIGTLNTLVGNNGSGGYAGDGGAASLGLISSPYGVAADSQGNVYIADLSNNRVRMVSTAGIISTFFGTGTAGSSGDGGPATAAKVNEPADLCFDAAGNLYVSEYGGNRIRKVTTAGIVYTVAGTGVAGQTGNGGQATSARINSPHGISVDSLGNLYIADSNNEMIRKVTTAGVISTVVGTGGAGTTGLGGPATSATLNFPTSVVVDNAGNLYIANYSSNVIEMVNTSGVISLLAGSVNTSGFMGDGLQATGANLSNPYGLALDSLGNLYISDMNNDRIRYVRLH